MSLEQLLAWIPPGSADEALAREVNFEQLPSHVAVIMDGNGRWAADRHLPRVEGHRAGINSVRDVVETSARLGIGVLTLDNTLTSNCAAGSTSDATPTAANHIGVLVSWRAKKPGWNTLINTKEGRPTANAASAAAVAMVSEASNSPLSKSTCTSGSARTARAIAAGRVSAASALVGINGAQSIAKQ